MTLPSATLFPQALLPLYIFEPRYRQMLTDSLKSERMFSVAMQKPGRTRESPCQVAGLGLIRVSVDHQDGTSHLILQGLTRVELRQTVQYKPYRVQCIRPLQAAPNDSVMVDALGECRQLRWFRARSSIASPVCIGNIRIEPAVLTCRDATRFECLLNRSEADAPVPGVRS